jgi:YggT family protein
VLIVSIVATILYYLLLIYFFVLWARFILDLLRNFSRNWRPRGIGLVLAEVVFSLTDRPIRTLRRVIPPIRVGGAALDFAWSIVMLVVIILIYITLALSESYVGV